MAKPIAQRNLNSWALNSITFNHSYSRTLPSKKRSCCFNKLFVFIHRLREKIILLKSIIKLLWIRILQTWICRERYCWYFTWYHLELEWQSFRSLRTQFQYYFKYLQRCETKLKGTLKKRRNRIIERKPSFPCFKQ